MRSLPDEPAAAAARRRRAAVAGLLALGWLAWLGGRGRLRLILSGSDRDEASTGPGRFPWAKPGSGPASSTSAARGLAGDWSFPGTDRTLVLPPPDGPHLIPGQPAPFGLENAPGPRPAAATAAEELRRSTVAAAAPPPRETVDRRPDTAEVPRTLIPVPDPKASGLREVSEPKYRAEPARSWTSDASPEETPAIAVDPSKAVLWVDTDGSGRLKPAGVPKK